jgi:sugar/nucleoside kinase (ribokinase family)
MNAVVAQETRALAAQPAPTGRMDVAEVLAHVTTVQQVMREVMKPDVHYGKIPGTEKPTLYKPGAELLCMTFRIATTYAPEDLSTDLVVRYRVTCTGTHQTTGVILGTGMGEASSGEQKYKWVKAYPEEWNATPENLRRKKSGWDKQKKQTYEVMQVRTDPADLANTILKMANKRALMAMVLGVTAASDCFAQDLEDMEERLRDHLARNAEEPAAAAEQQSAGPEPWPDEALNARQVKAPEWLAAGKTADEVIEFLGQKGVLSDAQKERIRGWMKPKVEVQDVTPKGDAPAVTYAQVATALNAAKTQEERDEAATLIAAVADEGQRGELNALYESLASKE